MHPERGQNYLEALEERKREATEAVIDYAFHMGVTWWGEESAKWIANCVHDEGISSFKAYMAYKDTVGLDDADLLRFEEVHRLSGGRVPSQSELDAARASKLRADAAVNVAEADVAESRAAVLANEIDLEKSVIRSPIDGVVLDCRIDPGQTVAASFQAPVLFTIGQDLSRMNLTVYVSEADVGRVSEGQKATFTVDAWPESEFEAVVRKVSFGSQTIQNVVSYVTELEVANDDLKLRPGMTATATIRIAERDGVLVVSNAALRFRVPARKEPSGAFSLLPVPPNLGRSEAPTDKDAVFVLREGALARVAVDAGLSDGRWTEVFAPDLHEGEAVVVGLLEAS